MIEQVVAKWHLYMRGQLEGGLDSLLADDCVFYSPIVFTPQVGKEITKMYLMAASQTLPGDKKSEPQETAEKDGKFMICSVRRAAIDALRAYLDTLPQPQAVACHSQI